MTVEQLTTCWALSWRGFSLWEVDGWIFERYDNTDAEGMK